MQKSIFLDGPLKLFVRKSKGFYACSALNSPACKNTPKIPTLILLNLHSSLSPYTLSLSPHYPTPPLLPTPAATVAIAAGQRGRVEEACDGADPMAAVLCRPSPTRIRRQLRSSCAAATDLAVVRHDGGKARRQIWWWGCVGIS